MDRRTGERAGRTTQIVVPLSRLGESSDFLDQESRATQGDERGQVCSFPLVLSVAVLVLVIEQQGGVVPRFEHEMGALSRSECQSCGWGQFVANPMTSTSTAELSMSNSSSPTGQRSLIASDTLNQRCLTPLNPGEWGPGREARTTLGVGARWGCRGLRAGVRSVPRSPSGEE